MKTLFAFLSALYICSFIAPLRAADTNGFALTVELQGGSRLIGKAGDENYRFVSDVLGEMKLSPGSIRSIEFKPGTNVVKITTSSGDTVQTRFLMKEIKITTAFGNYNLAANLLKQARISSLNRQHISRPGLVAMWLAENNGNDSVGKSDAILTDISFGDGKVGRAFNFIGMTPAIKVAADSNLNVGATGSFTLMAWINPSDVSVAHPIFEWNNNSDYGVHFYLFSGGQLYANVMGIDGLPHIFQTPPNMVVPGVFQHVALVYDRSSGAAIIYCNGNPVAQRNFGGFACQTTYDLYLGRRPMTHGETYVFAGMLDEAAIYNRALPAEEIKNIATEENNGEPLPPPPQPLHPQFYNGFRSGFSD